MPKTDQPLTAVLLPGSMCDARIWHGVADKIRGVRECHFIDADLARDDSIMGMAERVLKEASGRLVPIGFSMGGNVALEMARQAPERVAAIALIDVNPAADRAMRAAGRLDDQAEVRDGRLDLAMERAIRSYFASANPPPAPLTDLVRDMARTLGSDVFLRQNEALRTRADLRSVVARFDGPMFLACGADDQLCTPMMHEAMAQDARNATLAVIEHAGHMLPLEQPGQLAEALAAWIGGIALQIAGGSVDHSPGGEQIAC